MADFYIKYFELLDDENLNSLFKCIKIDDVSNTIDLISTKENIESLMKQTNRGSIITSTRRGIMKYLYFVWLEGIPRGPAEWWCEMWPNIKALLVLAACLESLNKKAQINYHKEMEIPQVLLKLWDYIASQQQQNNWSYVIHEYNELCKNHNDLRELYYC